VGKNKKTGKVSVRDISEFCYLNNPDVTAESLKNNHTEYAFDEKSKTVYFRTIMYGKHYAHCDRSVRVE
jgi:hypothetical protein